jgi:hypothetical protein
LILVTATHTLPDDRIPFVGSTPTAAMGLDFETRHLILGAHVFVGVGFFVFAAVLVSSGATTAGALRAALGTLIVGVGFYMYRLRS